MEHRPPIAERTVLGGRLALLALGTLVFFGLLFVAFQAIGLPISLTEPGAWMAAAGSWGAAAIGVGLLIADVLLPVPSSAVMVAHGAIFGPLWGTLLSLAGALGAAWAGFAIGRRGGWLVERLVSPEGRRRADLLLGRWGAVALVASRPVPLLAETVVVLAGTSAQISWARLTAAALAGAAPICLLYALTGAAIAEVDSLALMIGAVAIVTLGFWLVGRYLLRAADVSAEP